MGMGRFKVAANMALRADPDKNKAHRPPTGLHARCVGAAVSIASPRMANIHDDPAALKALQDDIYRERILRARKMTVEQRLSDVFELSNHQFGMMLGGAMHRLGTRDEAAGWQEVQPWMARLDQVREHGLYVTEKPAGA